MELEAGLPALPPRKDPGAAAAAASGQTDGRTDNCVCVRTDKLQKWKEANGVTGGNLHSTIGDNITDGNTESIIVTGISIMTLVNRMNRIVPECQQGNRLAVLQCHLMFPSYLGSTMIEKRTDISGYYLDITIVILLPGRQLINGKWKKSD